MNAWLPQAAYPCGNFSDTSSFKFRRSKGSIGHAITVHIRTGNQNQTSFYPFVPHEISVLVELILGHLRYLLTDVLPQPNSPPENVFRPDRLAEANLGTKRRGNAPPPTNGINDEAFGYLKRVELLLPLYRLVEFLHFDIQSTGQKSHCVPVLSRLFDAGKAPKGRSRSIPLAGIAATSSAPRGAARAVHRQPTGSGLGHLCPALEPILFPGYGSILPTSLAYIVPSTVGCSPWRPDAVMSTTRRGRHSVLRIFKGRQGRTGHHATCGALPAAGPYLRLSHFQGGQAVKQKR
ncbi:hypothetical protein H6P81_015978 [Aristolochia fimbriata]|uniref:Senescence-associated protein n=1 Tax=Aristolochia fimbriata TaxID=158543 RepID=A0AAV7E734_ARIFI|nr:hypothetical protein H6P81_015978 [Aristolochia fimbriata]